MLDKLYKKLIIIFTFGIMLILSVVIAIIMFSQIKTEQAIEHIFFQRTATFIIYQLEDTDTYLEEVMSNNEKRYPIVCNIKNASGKVIYQSTFSFPTSTKFLLDSLYEQAKRLSNWEQPTDITIDYGIFEIQGEKSDCYFGIPATIVSKDNTVYHLVLLYKAKTMADFLREHALFYLLIWITSLLCILFLSRFVLKKALNPTENVWKSQKEFIASASHELKSPLAVIVSNTDRIGKLGIENQELSTSITVMNAECMRMARLISDMLLLASSDAKTWSVNKKTINIDTLLISLYETYESVCKEHNILLNLNLNKTIYPVLQSDPERITQILGIFIDNALHHAGNTPTIQIQTSVTARNITFHIIDYGSGISEQDKPYVFDRFYCADKSHTDKSHFGLGLSIADELSKMLDGKIGFRNTIGGGTTFYLTIPLK
ncbi:MAG: HAMP domain-containing histidine kinase [Lachnospiraceae bacterium]|nr:HAMP domain-containing histidine kinase [Lachnospiraceae bacterium]MDE6253410.1 HAMP domain-containing histidine kinase [Lachnospiraceae bacterium]